MAIRTEQRTLHVDSVDSVVGNLRRYIQDEGLRAGAVLPPEIVLSRRFGASRNTVREAIRTLKAYGIVESRRRVGAVIVDRRQEAMMNLFSFAIDINVETFRDIQGFRRLIELSVTEDLIRRDDRSCLDAAAAINQRMREASDYVDAGRLDYQFHRTLVDGLENRTLSEVYGVLEPVISRLCELGKKARATTMSAADEHDLILDALRKKDSVAVAYHYGRHLHSGLQYLPDAKRDGEGVKAASGHDPVRPDIDDKKV